MTVSRTQSCGVSEALTAASQPVVAGGGAPRRGCVDATVTEPDGEEATGVPRRRPGVPFDSRTEIPGGHWGSIPCSPPGSVTVPSDVAGVRLHQLIRRARAGWERTQPQLPLPDCEGSPW